MTDWVRVLPTDIEAFLAFAPVRPGDVGHDLPCLISDSRRTWLDRLVSRWIGVWCYVIFPGQQRSIHSGIRLSMQASYWAFIDARSSARKKRLDVSGGRIIDSGYRGEFFTILSNQGWLPRIIRHRERYAQVVFIPAVRPHRTLATLYDFEKEGSERGSAGFGSTGR